MRDADVILADGGTIHVRSVEPSDAAGLRAMHARFSERTRYFRFFSSYPRIPDRDLRRFANVDHRDREALIALVGTDVIAVGRYERLGTDSFDAEVAFAVEDDHQRRGIAPILLERLADAAREAGFRRFVAEVLPSNSRMLHVFAEAGYEITSEYADGVIHVAFPIGTQNRGPDDGPSRGDVRV
jgi:GNAT superfamily N-acetyltransferase